jgi:hypothetical protein
VSHALESYWARSQRPLHVLVFLLPLVIVYEIGSVVFLTDPRTQTQIGVAANRLFSDFFSLFGPAAAFLPGVALLVVLLVWHVLSRDRWSVEPKTLGGMLIESLAWTMPLLVLAAASSHAKAVLAVPAPGGVGALSGLSIGAEMTIAVGAGLYEEMLFRLVGLALLHFILVDLIGLTERVGAAVAVVLAALAFAVYHQPQLPAQWPDFLFYTVAGIYLGSVYVMRGFGIVVATHAVYDVAVLSVLGG